jgi:hypothetical protein
MADKYEQLPPVFAYFDGVSVVTCASAEEVKKVMANKATVNTQKTVKKAK